MAADPNPRPVIDIRNVWKVYQLDGVRVNALQGVTIAVEPGDFLAIMGPSGSGKSTLMNLIGCLDRPTTGEYWLDGVNVATLSERELARIRNQKIGFVFQNFYLLARYTALENVELPMLYAGVPAKTRREIAVRCLERVGLAKRMDHKPNAMSGGERQRVAIARAMVNSPSVILADEPTGNLDSKVSEEIMGIFHELNEQGNTIVMVTHEPDIAGHARNIVRFRDGEIIGREVVRP